jgi:hypothetical protein
MSNKIGWLVGAGLLLAVGGLVTFMMLRQEPHDPPTSATTGEGFLQVHKTSLPLTDVLPKAPQQEGNPIEYYWRAAKLFLQNRDEILAQATGTGEGVDPEIQRKIHSRYKSTLDVAVALTPTGLAKLEEIHEHVRTGTSKKNPDVLGVVDMSQLVVTDPTQCPAAQALEELHEAQEILILYHLVRNQLDKAERHAHDMMIFGYHLNRSRARAPITVLGLKAEHFALTQMFVIARIRDDQQRISQIRRYNEHLSSEARDPTINKLIVLRKARLEAGDLIHIAEDDQDRMWKVEATLMMGPMKFMQESIERNRRKIDELIQEHKNSSDPLVRAAAETADAFTREDARDFGVHF